MDCGRFGEGLIDVALRTRPPDAAESAHLAACPQCRGRVEDERRAAEGVDRLLAEALAVEPSPALMVRVRERVSPAHAPRRKWRAVWAPALAAAVALVALTAVGVSYRATTPASGLATRSATSVRRPVQGEPTTAPGRPAVPPPRLSPRGASSAPTAAPALQRRASARPVHGPGRGEPEVVIPPGQELELLRLLAALHGGRLDAGSLVASQGGSNEPLVPPKAIEISPLEAPPDPDGSQGNSEFTTRSE